MLSTPAAALRIPSASAALRLQGMAKTTDQVPCPRAETQLLDRTTDPRVQPNANPGMLVCPQGRWLSCLPGHTSASQTASRQVPARRRGPGERAGACGLAAAAARSAARAAAPCLGGGRRRRRWRPTRGTGGAAAAGRCVAGGSGRLGCLQELLRGLWAKERRMDIDVPIQQITGAMAARCDTSQAEQHAWMVCDITATYTCC